MAACALRSHQREFARYLSQVEVKRRATVVPRTGWHQIGGRLVFVLPGETIGRRGGESVMLENATPHGYGKRGTLDEWRDSVAKLAQGHLLAILAISTALSGTLLYLTGFEGGGAHLCGPSSTGKSTLLKMAASVWGPPGFVRSWRTTANGLEGAAAIANDAILILDELGQVEARELAAAPYLLSNGVGKARAARDGSLRDSKTWRAQFLSSGEIPVDAKLVEEKGRKPPAGQLVRMLNIPASRACGVFDDDGPDGDAASLAKTCARAAGEAYGVAGPEFVRRLMAENVSGDEVRSMVDDFVADEVSEGADGQVTRVAQRLGLIAAAGELATRLGIVPWGNSEARAALASVFAQWLEGREGIEPAEVRQAIEQVRHFIEAHGESRFDDGSDVAARPVHNRAGWRKGSDENRRWMIPPEVWKVEVCGGLDSKFTAKVLAERGMLEKGADGSMKVEKIEGASKRVYVITPRIFDGG
jgi:uncharacterized protein (DUF927 family)